MSEDTPTDRELDGRPSVNRTQLLATALECLTDGVALVDSQGKYLYTNPAHALLLGYPAGEPPADGPIAVAPDEETREFLRTAFAGPEASVHWTGRVECRRVDNGKLVPVDLTRGSAQIDGAPVTFSILHDATETLSQEKRVRQMEQLARIGTLVGGVAHELNNPLHAIQNLVELLLLNERPDIEKEDLEIIRREVDRMAQIVAGLRRVGREPDDGAAEMSPVDLNEVVRHVLRTRGFALLGQSIQVREDLGLRLPPVLGSRGQLEQVVLNLIVNAEQALASIPGERRIIVRTRPSAKGAVLHVVDNGPGIASDHIASVFDPFFTTKPVGEGTGLGLAVVHSIVAAHGGEIHVDSEVGSGAAFRVDLPKADCPASCDSRPAAAPAVQSRRVLIVDDEEPVRRSIVRFLRQRGHEVDEVSEGEAALQRISETDYDVVLSDLLMPGISGAELMERLREKGVGERVIFMTGDATNHEGIGLLCAAGVTVLLKPLALTDIADAVEHGIFLSS